MKIVLLGLATLGIAAAATFFWTKDAPTPKVEREASVLGYRTIDDAVHWSPLVVQADYQTERTEHLPAVGPQDERTDVIRTFRVSQVLKGATSLEGKEILVRTAIEVHQRASGAAPEETRRSVAPPVASGRAYVLFLQSLEGSSDWIYVGHPSHAAVESDGSLFFWTNPDVKGELQNETADLVQRSSLSALRTAVAHPAPRFVPPDIGPAVNLEVAGRFDQLVKELPGLQAAGRLDARVAELQINAKEIGNPSVCHKYEGVIRELSGVATFALGCDVSP